MNSQEWFGQLRKSLAGKGIPAAYTDRLIEELQLHFRASVDRYLLGSVNRDEAGPKALAALGTGQEIVETTLQTLRQESFVGRNRFLSLIIGPAVLMMLSRIAVVVLFVLSGMPRLHIYLRHYPYLLRGLIMFFDSRISLQVQGVLCNIVVPSVFVVWIWGLGCRKFCGLVYTAASCGILMFLGYWFQLKWYPGGAKPPHTFLPSVYQIILLSVYGLLAWRVWGKNKIDAQYTTLNAQN